MIILVRYTLAIGVILLTGCVSTRYGVDEESWEFLTEDQKAEVIASYYKSQALDSERRLLEARTRNALVEEQTKHEWKEEKSEAHKIRVKLRGGYLRYEGKNYWVKKSELVLSEGKKTELKLKNHKDPDSSIKLPVSYKEGRLIIGKDRGGSHARSQIILPYLKSWERGKTYHHVSMPLRSKVRGSISLEVETKSPKKRNKDDDFSSKYDL